MPLRMIPLTVVIKNDTNDTINNDHFTITDAIILHNDPTNNNVIAWDQKILIINDTCLIIIINYMLIINSNDY